MTQYIRMSLIFDKTVKALIAKIYYKEKYLKPNSDPGTLQTSVMSLGNIVDFVMRHLRVNTKQTVVARLYIPWVVTNVEFTITSKLLPNGKELVTHAYIYSRILSDFWKLWDFGLCLTGISILLL